MSKHSSEQRSYSVDEMMDRLKDGEREKRSKEDSELVTRPDGTQVVRVRRRKRRSKQPAKAAKVRRKRSGLILLAFLAVLLVGLLVTVLVILARFNSKGYRDALKENLLRATGARVSLEDLSVSPLKAGADTVEFEWPGGGLAKSLTLDSITADLKATSFFGADMTGKEVLVRSGTLFLSPPIPELPRTRAKGGLPMTYEQFRSTNFAIVFGDPEQPAIHLKSAEVTSRPTDDGMQLLCNGGRITLAGWGELKVYNGLADFGPKGFSLVSFRAMDAATEGEVTIGTSKARKPGEPVLLNVSLKEFPLGFVLGKGLGRLIQGSITTESGTASVDPRFLDSLETRIEFEGKNGKLEGFHFLAGLRTILSDSYYAEPDDGELQGVYRRNSEGIELQQFQFTSKSKLRVTGNLSVNTLGELNGEVQVGVPVGSIRSPLGKKQYQAFSDGEGGYSWIDITIGGTVESPIDDFATKLRQAARERTESERSPHILEDNFVLPRGE